MMKMMLELQILMLFIEVLILGGVRNEVPQIAK